MATRRLVALGALAMVAGCATSTETRDTAATPAATTTATTDVASGPARSCVNLQQIRESRVRSNDVVDFVLVNGSTLRNRLPYSCPQLGFERSFTYATSLSQLCSTDIITVIVQGGGPSRGASCGLGQFTPISDETAKLDVK